MKSLMTRIQTTANEGGSQFLSTLPWTADRTSTCVWAQDSLHCNILSPGSRANNTRIHAVKPQLIEASKFRPRSSLVLVKLPPQVLAARQILQTLQGHASKALLVAPGLEHWWSKGSRCSLISGQFMPGVLLCSWRFGIMAFDLKSSEIHIRHFGNYNEFCDWSSGWWDKGGIGPRTDAPLIGPPSKRELTECVWEGWQS